MVIAQQLIDASKDGGAAFIAFSIMVFLFTGSLFYMDRVRRKREERAASSSRVPTASSGASTAAASIVGSMSASVCARLGNSVS